MEDASLDFMNILMTTEYYYGNPDMVRLSTELAKKGHQVDVLTSFSPSFYQFDRPEGVPNVDIIEANPHIDIVSLPYTVTFPLVQVASLIRKHGIDVCHSVMARATNSATVSFVSKQLKKPHVHTVQGIGTDVERLHVDLIAYAYDRTMVRFILKSAKKVIVLSESLKPYSIKRGADPEKIVVVPNGVDCSFFDSESSEAREGAHMIREKFKIPEDELVVGYIGRMVPVKGLKYLIQAMSEVQRKHPSVHLLMVGDGFEKAELQETAQKLGLKAHFAGWGKNVLSFYAAIDIFVLPSLLEGLSNSLLEAMSMGRPIIATWAGGNKDIIINGKNGFLVPPQDSESIASNTMKLIESEVLRKSMGQGNRERALREFIWEKTVSRIEQVYKSVID